MTVIFCDIGWLDFYDGENEEIYSNNFLDYNGFCYGDMFNKPQILENSKKDVTVIFLSKNEFDSEPVIVGFYRNATIYNKEQVELDKYSIGRELHYFAKAKSSDCFLIPTELRNFVVTENMKSDINSIMNILEYIDTINFKKANIVYDDKNLSLVMPNNALSYDELMDAGDNEIENENFYKALIYFNTAFHINKNIDAIFNIASMLESLFCFNKAIQIFEKLRELEGDEIDTLDNLLNLYLQTKQYEKAMEICNLSIDLAQQDDDIEGICGLLCVKSDIFVQTKHFEEAIKCLDFIIDNSEDELMVNEVLTCKNNLLKK